MTTPVNFFNLLSFTITWYIFFAESKYAVKTKIIAADFSLGPKAVEFVKNEVGSLPINILGKC